jgi:hypothetical protein
MHMPTDHLHPEELSTHRKKMIRVTLVTLSAAVIIFVVAILPAEFGIDPLRTGKSLGFSSLYQEDGVKTNTLILQNQKYLTDDTEITIEPGKGIEYKYRLAKGAPMLFSWVSTEYVVFDFHGEPTGGKPGEFESHETGVGAEQHGTLTTPFTGTHGWYWENQSEQPVIVNLNTAGYYEIVGIKK